VARNSSKRTSGTGGNKDAAKDAVTDDAAPAASDNEITTGAETVEGTAPEVTDTADASSDARTADAPTDDAMTGKDAKAEDADATGDAPAADSPDDAPADDARRR
jgi:hypothetical protein